MREIASVFSAGRRFATKIMAKVFLGGFLTAAVAAGFAPAAQAASPAEQYVNENVQKGMVILTNKSLSKDQRREQFQDFLLTLADLKGIADYTLGQYRRGAPAGDIAAYEAAYKEYALAVYRSYFDKFFGQTLQVTGSYPLSGGDSVVKTVMHDPSGKIAKPLMVNFRVSNAGGHFVVTDISAEGVWLRQTQRDDFTSFLGQNGGDIKALIGVLKNKTKQEQAHAR